MKGYRLSIEGCWFESSRLHAPVPRAHLGSVVHSLARLGEPTRDGYLETAERLAVQVRTRCARSSALSSTAECLADNRMMEVRFLQGGL